MKTIEIEVPNAEEYQIDNFLGNILQYKIDDNWIYDSSIKLPVDNLEIIDIKKCNNRTWLKISLS